MREQDLIVPVPTNYDEDSGAATNFMNLYFKRRRNLYEAIAVSAAIYLLISFIVKIFGESWDIKTVIMLNVIFIIPTAALFLIGYNNNSLGETFIIYSRYRKEKPKNIMRYENIQHKYNKIYHQEREEETYGKRRRETRKRTPWKQG